MKKLRKQKKKRRKENKKRTPGNLSAQQRKEPAAQLENPEMVHFSSLSPSDDRDPPIRFFSLPHLDFSPETVSSLLIPPLQFLINTCSFLPRAIPIKALPLLSISPFIPLQIVPPGR
jgi:hypothetical protein